MDLSDYAVDDSRPSRALAPSSVEDVSAAIGDAHRAREAVVLWGGGTRIGVGQPPERYDVALDLRGLRGIVDHSPADLVCTVRAGTTIADLAAELARSG
ncbi:MAG TPA: FAD-binding protein, partial [Candidatus Limnocylindria bacterium]|nr:FAD-binding protein [Candidatus Limnocylindria bacterium]